MHQNRACITGHQNHPESLPLPQILTQKFSVGLTACVIYLHSSGFRDRWSKGNTWRSTCVVGWQVTDLCGNQWKPRTLVGSENFHCVTDCCRVWLSLRRGWDWGECRVCEKAKVKWGKRRMLSPREQSSRFW